MDLEVRKHLEIKVPDQGKLQEAETAFNGNAYNPCTGEVHLEIWKYGESFSSKKLSTSQYLLQYHLNLQGSYHYTAPSWKFYGVWPLSRPSRNRCSYF